MLHIGFLLFLLDHKSQFLASEIVKSNMFIRDSEIFSHFLNRLVHEWWSTEVEFNILRGFMVIEVMLDRTRPCRI